MQKKRRNVADGRGKQCPDKTTKTQGKEWETLACLGHYCRERMADWAEQAELYIVDTYFQRKNNGTCCYLLPPRETPQKYGEEGRRSNLGRPMVQPQSEGTANLRKRKGKVPIPKIGQEIAICKKQYEYQDHLNKSAASTDASWEEPAKKCGIQQKQSAALKTETTRKWTEAHKRLVTAA